LHTLGTCNTMKEEDEEYDLHHKNEVTSEDFQDFEDMPPNTAEIRDADPSMTKQLVDQAEKVLNNLFNGDTGDFRRRKSINRLKRRRKN